MTGRSARSPQVRRHLQRLVLGVFIALCAGLGASCTTVKPVQAASHPRTYVVDCSGASLSWSHCYLKAGRACPHGYTVKQKPYQHGERITAGDFLQLLGNSGSHRRMLIECKEPASDAPDPAAILSGHAG
ncbi:MAG: hypothetical protein EPN38_03690 [Rhodanobacteraceae bacterium]|nr:MAG: hypothetical protein EPN38_03690 [Rhodanobacteraceae bacterium]